MADIPFLLSVAAGVLPDPTQVSEQEVEIVYDAQGNRTFWRTPRGVFEDAAALLANVNRELHENDCRIQKRTQRLTRGRTVRETPTRWWEALGPLQGTPAMPARQQLAFTDDYIEAVQAVVKFLLPETRGVD